VLFLQFMMDTLTLQFLCLIRYGLQAAHRSLRCSRYYCCVPAPLPATHFTCAFPPTLLLTPAAALLWTRERTIPRMLLHCRVRICCLSSCYFFYLTPYSVWTRWLPCSGYLPRDDSAALTLLPALFHHTAATVTSINLYPSFLPAGILNFCLAAATFHADISSLACSYPPLPRWYAPFMPLRTACALCYLPA